MAFSKYDQELILQEKQAKVVHLKDEYIEHIANIDANEASAIMYKETRPWLAFEHVDDKHVVMFPMRSHTGHQNGNDKGQFSVYLKTPTGQHVDSNHPQQNVDVSVGHFMTKADFIEYAYEFQADERHIWQSKPSFTDDFVIKPEVYQAISDPNFQLDVMDAYYEFALSYRENLDAINFDVPNHEILQAFQEFAKPIKNVAMQYHQELMGVKLEKLDYKTSPVIGELDSKDTKHQLSSPNENLLLEKLKILKGRLTAYKIEEKTIIETQPYRRVEYQKHELERREHVAKINNNRYVAPKQGPYPNMKPPIQKKVVNSQFDEMEI